MPKVYAPQKTLTRDQASGRLVPKFSLDPGDPLGAYVRRNFGEIVWLLDSSEDLIIGPDRVAEKMQRGLESFQTEDYLLCIGPPELIGLMTLFAGDHANVLRFLRWERRQRSYQVIITEV